MKKVVGGGNKWFKFEINGDGECDWNVCNVLIEKSDEVSRVMSGDCDYVVDVKFSELEGLIDGVSDVDESERKLWNDFVEEVELCDESGEWLSIVKMFSFDGSGWCVGVLLVSVIN